MNLETRYQVLVDRLTECSDEEIRALLWLARLHIDEVDSLGQSNDNRWDVLSLALEIEEQRRRLEIAELEQLYFRK